MEKPDLPHLPTFMLIRLGLEDRIVSGEIPVDAADLVLTSCFGCLDELYTEEEIEMGLCPDCQRRRQWLLN